MLLIIPSMELQNGACVNIVQGEAGTEGLYRRYAADPAQLGALWRRENARCLHVTDRDGYIGGNYDANRAAIERLSDSIDIPVTLLSRFRDVETCRRWLQSGVYRIIINILARTDPDGVRALIQEFSPSRIVFGVLADRGVVDHGGEHKSESDENFGRYVRSLGATRIFYTDKKREGSLAGPDMEALERIAQSTGLRVTAAGGVADVHQLWRLQDLQPAGVDSVVVGRALYENRFPCQRIWRMAEARCESNSN